MANLLNVAIHIKKRDKGYHEGENDYKPFIRFRWIKYFIKEKLLSLEINLS